MTKLNSEIRAILIGGSSHVGKSTLGKSLSNKLDWNYISTDSLAKHPGRPWINANTKVIQDHVVKHYKYLSVKALLLDVLSHYQQNVLPQVETLVRDNISNLSNKHLIIEGSALYPEFVVDLVNIKNVRGIWLTASGLTLQNRIYKDSNFYNVSQEDKYLIQKFLARTILYNRRIKKDLEDLKLEYIDVESVTTLDELVEKCLKQIDYK